MGLAESNDSLLITIITCRFNALNTAINFSPHLVLDDVNVHVLMVVSK